MMCRAVVFYVMCAVALMCSKFTHVREIERKNYMTFVLSVYVRLVVQSTQSAPGADTEQAKPDTAKRLDITHVKRTAEKRHESVSSREERDENSELLRKLIAAKAANGVN
jgi:hypothetical protein